MKYVLFVCTHDAGRSQIAQAFFERYAPADIRAESAGEEPAAAIWPHVIEAMREVGIDISHRRPKKLGLEMQLHADWAITLRCKASCPFVPSQVEDWEVDDLAGRPLEQVREIRDEIEQRVRDFVETRLEDVRTAETAHRLRLQKLIPSLVEEFGELGVRSDGSVRYLRRARPLPLCCDEPLLAARQLAHCIEAEATGARNFAVAP